MNLSPPWKNKQNREIAPLHAVNKDSKDDLFSSKRATLAKSKSQLKVAATKSKANVALVQILIN